ncbi:MAG: hypothetical protein KF696_06900 [Planctomycetes bacterium]|nr:hypothetical protein [Planctomycetota bacterium]MCW8135284.1 hypothetical protein [Planctomycetota bacterium]
MLLTACAKPGPAKIDDDDFEIPPKEAQSDFLDVGTQAGIKWLSFVPNAERDYPELFDGLDRDQRRRLRLAPLAPADQRVLLEFKLPPDNKIWPVEWYEVELAAVDHASGPEVQSSVAIATDDGRDPLDYAYAIAKARGGAAIDRDAPAGQAEKWCFTAAKGAYLYVYGAKRLSGKGASMIVVVEDRIERTPIKPADLGAVEALLKAINIKRELALEGSPKHKVSSSIEVLQKGTLHYPDGSLALPVGDGHAVRKIGGDSTVQVDGEGASPWLLLRRLAPTKAAGDIRVRVRNDPVFNRRLKDPSGRFSAGYDPGWNFPAVLWDYSGSGLEQYVLGVMVVGDELLTLEVVSTGLREGEARRKAKQAALELLAGAHTAPVGQRGRISTLIGWNVGTMGKE